MWAYRETKVSEIDLGHAQQSVIYPQSRNDGLRDYVTVARMKQLTARAQGQKSANDIRGDVRKEMKSKLVETTGDITSDMEWRHYWDHMVRDRGIMIVGWPHAVVPFCNLSEGTNSIRKLRLLLEHWKTGKTYFQVLSPKKHAAVRRKLQELIADGSIALPPPRKARSDRGKDRVRVDRLGARPEKVLVTTLTPETVDSDSDMEDTVSEYTEDGHRHRDSEPEGIEGWDTEAREADHDSGANGPIDEIEDFPCN
ncbi:hypothetical protein FA95DRAFT_1576557 [Auriscalpium vulgare]|uniref:Uncharacterized protein n=1 Tax=Auriscalpium vulgare TaxID=40419 RepID=A0ACB8RBX3_9AGAM|nr:hypothetical protein FA95DRAFT_1576557 [Auriscalpium vulgare]